VNGIQSDSDMGLSPLELAVGRIRRLFHPTNVGLMLEMAMWNGAFGCGIECLLQFVKLPSKVTLVPQTT